MAEIDGVFRFFPTDDQLIDCYLRTYLVRTDLADLPTSVSSFFHEVDVYSAYPEQLVADLAPAPGTADGERRVWCMFTPVRSLSNRVARKSRVVCPSGNETWHAEGGPKNINGSAAGGKLQKFSYKIKTASGVVKPGWLMVEYSVPDVDHLALCKVYRSSRATRSTGSSSSSSCSTSTASPVSGCKRKAEEEHPEAPPRSVQRQTPPEEGHDDSMSRAESHKSALYTAPSEHDDDDDGAAAGTVIMSDELTTSVPVPVPVQDTCYGNFGFEEADPSGLDNSLPVDEDVWFEQADLDSLNGFLFEQGAAASQPVETAVHGPFPDEHALVMCGDLPWQAFDQAFVDEIVLPSGDDFLVSSDLSLWSD